MSDSGDGTSDEEHDLVGNNYANDDESENGADPSADSADAPGLQETPLYVYFNKGYYLVPRNDIEKDALIPGCKRCYDRIVKVSDGQLLGAMVQGAEGWPKGDALTETMISSDKIVVVTGKLNESDVVLSAAWYLLIEVEGSVNKQDHQIMRHIPRAVYKEVLNSIKKNPGLSRSQLLGIMQAENDNAKPLNPLINGFVKVTGDDIPKTACIMPEKQPRNSKKEGLKKADKTTCHDSNKHNSDGPDPGADKAQEKKPKPSVSSFWKVNATNKSAVADSKSKNASQEAAPDKSKSPSQEEEAVAWREEEGAPAAPEKSKPPPQENQNGVEAQSAPEKPKADRVAKRKSSVPTDKVSIKASRTQSVESHNIALDTDSGDSQLSVPKGGIGSIDIVVPAGAKAGTATITWIF